MKFIVRAPTRIGLIGGGTDVNPFASQQGGQVIGLAINIYHHTTLVPRKDSLILIENLGETRQFDLDEQLPKYGEDKKFDLVYAIINHFKKKFPSGFNLYDRFEGKHSAGLGSSGSAGVTIIGAINQWLELNLTIKEIALLSWKIETKELGWISGKQDQLMAVFGGLNLMTFGPGETFSVNPIKLSENEKNKLRQWLILVYTGGTRHSSSLQHQLKKGMTEKKKIQALTELKKAVKQFEQAIINGQWHQAGEILNQAWQNKKKSNPAVTNDRIDFLYQLAQQHGAIGGKVMGAGGEGHMFFFCPPKNQSAVIRALEAEGVEHIDFEIDESGLIIEDSRPEIFHHRISVRQGFRPTKDWAVFFDRDGTINQETHLLHRLKDFVLIPGVVQAIKKLNQLNIPVIIHNNASVVARGLCTEAQVQKLHQHMNQKLAKSGAFIDVIVYCPHHPTAFSLDYIHDCSWRKPKSGMIKAMARIFNLNLSKSYVVGDSPRDILMGQRENCFSILVKTGHAGQDALYQAKPDATVKNIIKAVELILDREKIS
jgi:D-glycero-alpha-D-manno-heptose-7-phosphate kinase